jgi:hypothetical protein
VSRNRIADLQLRGSTRPLPVRVYWPRQTGSRPVPLLVFCSAGAGAGSAAEAACRRLSQDAGLVVLSVSCAAGPQDGTNVLEWAAEHATELGADPGRLLIAGEAAGGVVAAAVASHARAAGWPAVTLAADDPFEAVRRLLAAGSDEFPGSASSDLRISQPRGMTMHDAAALPELAGSPLARSADRSRWMALVVLCTGMLMIVLDTTSARVNLSSLVRYSNTPRRS